MIFYIAQEMDLTLGKMLQITQLQYDNSIRNLKYMDYASDLL